MSESGSSSAVLTSRSSFPRMSQRRAKSRNIADRMARLCIGFGGVSVIIAVCLIFFYLLWEVMPLFRPAKIDSLSYYESARAAEEILHFGVEEQNEVAYSIGRDGVISFFDYRSGQKIDEQPLNGTDSQAVTIDRLAESGIGELYTAYVDQKAIFFGIAFNHRFDMDGNRTIVPEVTYPLGETWQDFSIPASTDTSPFLDASAPRLALRDSEEKLTLAASLNGELFLKNFAKEASLFGDAVELSPEQLERLPQPLHRVKEVLIGPDHRWLYLVQEQSTIEVYDLWAKKEQHLRYSRIDLGNEEITVAQFLLGANSLLVGTDSGLVKQLVMVRDDNNDYTLQQIREFKVSDNPIRVIEPEQRRKGFMAVDEMGLMGVFNTTAERKLVDFQLKEGLSDNGLLSGSAAIAIALSPRANSLLTLDFDDNQFRTYLVDNEHPDISWGSLWNEVWYEGYAEPEYIWQSSAANNDFEPKYSLVPLAFGTLKAAFYAMLMAMPLAICGAIYTAYFMAPALRSKVKPAVELMEALPTVILGFLAGLWLAPLLEAKLPGVFALLFAIPVSVLIFSFLWIMIPGRWRHWIDGGWQPVLLVPLILLVGWGALSISEELELFFFGGDIRGWLTNDMGVGYDQRNALVVGLAMGFAVIPTIFSIAEDALFAVPKHLSFGSLALGATPWQTVVRVVLPTASPGIFSAVMIGFGRAVGETMIVLMATGNTPIMDMNIFEGLRTLSANIAVEMPEAEKDSTHYRILFLAALVLFAFTFMFNTTAEYVRQRLREKYGNL